MDTLSRFFAVGVNFNVLLFAFFDMKPLLERGLLLQQKILLCGSKFFPYKIDPSSGGRQKRELYLLKVHPFPISVHMKTYHSCLALEPYYKKTCLGAYPIWIMLSITKIQSEICFKAFIDPRDSEDKTAVAFVTQCRCSDMPRKIRELLSCSFCHSLSEVLTTYLLLGF